MSGQTTDWLREIGCCGVGEESNRNKQCQEQAGEGQSSVSIVHNESPYLLISSANPAAHRLIVFDD
jgi:hypothetical protein